MAFKIIHVFLLASVKYFLTFPYSLIIGLDYEVAMLSVIGGGVVGFLCFYYLSRHFRILIRRVKPYIKFVVPEFLKIRYKHYIENRKKVKVKIFTAKTRFIVRLRRSYGFWGIILTTPVLLTIPLGAFLAHKYYSRRKNIVLYMVLSIVGWGAALGAFLQIFPGAVK
jgi:hypothetical protein